MAKSSKFTEYLDYICVVEQEAIEEQGEDCFCALACEDRAVVAVCDGCGGLGSRSYRSTTGHTEAFLASRMVAGTIYDWFCDTKDTTWKGGEDLCKSLHEYIARVYQVGSSYIQRGSRIRGSMVRDFPTTLAMAVAQQDGKDTILHVIWAGDSRVYLLNENGLAQLTVDDVEGNDAMTNLTDDGALTNVLSSDGKFDLHYQKLIVDSPTMVFAATDGCFGYIPSPMEFEYTLLNALVQAQTPEMFKQLVKKYFTEVAGDDFAFASMSFRFGSFDSMAGALLARAQYLEQEYIVPLLNGRSDDLVMSLWQKYRPSYERYIN